MQIAGIHFEVSLLNVASALGLVAIALARAVTPRSWHLAVATVLSAALIGLGSWATLAMLVTVTLGVVYPLSRLIARSREAAPRRAKALLAVGILAIIAAWVLFKLNREIELPFVHGTAISAELLR